MAFLTERKNTESDILSIFELPLETGSRIYYEEDLEESGFLELLDDFSRKDRKTILAHGATLAGIKAELAFHFLRKCRELLSIIPIESLGKWTSVVLDIFDSKGLNPAIEFILNQEADPLFLRHWGKGISFNAVQGILSNYLHALGKEDLRLETADEHYTDTQIIYLPERIANFSSEEENFLLYKVMVTHKFAQIAMGTYRLDRRQMLSMTEDLTSRYDLLPEQIDIPELSRFFRLFPDPLLAEDILNFLESIRIERWLAKTLPGLARRMEAMKEALARKREELPNLPPRSRVLDCAIRRWLNKESSFPEDPRLADAVEKIGLLVQEINGSTSTVAAVAALTWAVYEQIDALPGFYQPVEPLPYAGVLKPVEAERGRKRNRASIRMEFREELSEMIQGLDQCEEVRVEIPEIETDAAEEKNPQPRQAPSHLLLDGNPVPIPQSMKKIIEQIYEDLGAIPGDYFATGEDMSGHHFRSLCQTPTGTSNILSEHGKGVCIYDEWDYRRQGYRKHWALLRESDATGGDLAFSNEALHRHGGMIQGIKRQFERIRLEQTLLRRQKEGDRVDLDAAIEAFADRRAGLNPSERVFMSLTRDKRDIAAAFLIDLSGSTKGWINDLERTSLLILSEALEVLKDRFAIYGFSGRTRKRCELFRIKGFEEPYGDPVKARIAGLQALDYTRMGPPIRHLTRIINQVEHRTRLLITLSDGKPDDYDGYKGEYGIEDTRQALIEARRSGIHPFCITIDKAEHSYLSHMYGEANYAFIDDIEKLPIKIPQIYRKLTA